MELPQDAKGKAVQITPRKVALARTYDTTISSATSVTLNGDTTFVEVTALDQGIFMRYQASVSSTNFDEFIAAGMTRHFLVPAGVTVLSFIEEAASAKLIVIEK